VLSGNEAVRTFMAAWNTDDDAERLQLLSSCCAADAEFISPQGVLNGIDAMSTAMGEFRRAFPSALVANGAIDVHNASLRFHWQTNWNDGREALRGDDFGRLDNEGRITSMVSFYGSPAEPE
jgi:SnoaL-like domain